MSSLASGAGTFVRDFFSLHTLHTVDDQTIRQFRFEQGVTPLSSALGVALCVALYVATVRTLQWWIRKRGKAFDLNWYVILHNSAMSIISGVLFLSLLTELVLRVRSHGLWSVTCDPAGEHVGSTIYFIYFLNYICKYLELVDTCLLALRGKPIPFLHIYHHAATLVLCWSQLWAQSCIQWLPIVINLLVHVVMYAYYTLHALGKDIWWKKYLTLLQIVQFVCALVGCVLALGSRFASLTLGLLPTATFNCHGTYGGAYVGIAIIASYLALFVKLYSEKYDTPKRKAATVQPHSEAHVNGSGLSKRVVEANGNGARNGGGHRHEE